MLNVLITGSNGFLGSELLKSNFFESHKLYCLNRSIKAKFCKAINLEIDITNPFELPRINFDIVIHLAAKIPNDLNEVDNSVFNKTNHIGTLNLIKALKNNNCKQFIYISSHSVSELDREDIVSYAISKLKAENVLKESNINYTIIRPSGIFKDAQQLLYYVNKTKTSRQIYFIGNNSYLNLVHYSDVVKVITKCINNKNVSKKTIQLNSSNKISIKDFIKILINKNNPKQLKIFVNPFILYPLYFVLNLFQIKKKKVVYNLISSRKLTHFKCENLSLIDYTPKTIQSIIEGIV